MTDLSSEAMLRRFQAGHLRVFERGWLSSNNILFSGAIGHENVLVDTGYCAHAEQTLSLVRAVLGHANLGRVVNTHLHSDHCGGNCLLQTVYGCEVDVPQGEAAKVDAWDEDGLSFRSANQRCPRFARSGSIGAGSLQVLGGLTWQVLASPGHDPESVVLYQPELKLLISADALWENGFGVVFPEIEGMDAFNSVGSTLDMLAELDVDWVIPGHGRPFAGAAAAIDRAHGRLQSFVESPLRHARHAAKVLLKFHLLEMGNESLTAARDWSVQTPYLHLLHRAHFKSRSFSNWIDDMLRDLVTAGVARIDGETVFNV